MSKKLGAKTAGFCAQNAVKLAYDRASKAANIFNTRIPVKNGGYGWGGQGRKGQERGEGKGIEENRSKGKERRYVERRRGREREEEQGKGREGKGRKLKRIERGSECSFKY
jgi:hypothetical protein